MGPLVTVSPLVTDALIASLALTMLLISISALRGFLLFLAKKGAVEPEESPEWLPRKSKQSRK